MDWQTWGRQTDSRQASTNEDRVIQHCNKSYVKIMLKINRQTDRWTDEEMDW